MPAHILLYALQNDLEKVSTIGLPATATIDDIPARKLANTVVVRWGKSMIPAVIDDNGQRDFKYVINPSRAIRLNVQKKLAHQVMSRVVRMPRLFEKKVPEGVVAIMRPLAHEEGSGFRAVRGPMTIPNGKYATAFVENDTEVRVWFARTGRVAGETIMAYRAAMEGQREGKFPCRASFGYEAFQHPPKHLHELALRAATSIGLDFGAADILVVGGKGVLLELNSAPSVDFRNIRTFFKEALPKVVKAKYPGLKLEIEDND